MAYDGKLLARARVQLDKNRSDNQLEQQRRISAVYLRCPEIGRIDQRLREQMTELVRLTIARAPGMAERIAALKEESLDLQIRRAELLTELGYPHDYLDEILSCKKCGDTGIYNGGVCECLEKLYNRELTKELGTLMQNGDESFERFDLSLYPEADREHMANVCAVCRRFADSFPRVSSNLLFRGGTGLGKTFLSACIARVVAEKGYSVCYDSAAAALEAFELQKFARAPEDAENAAFRVKRMLDCDLMILDDLGTEMVTSLTKSALYTLINTRLVNGKKTIISTNLNDRELGERYTPQISSRISGEYLALPFVGRDIRLIRKGV